jgi:uncharacterized protein (DUF1501 family)
MKRRDFIRNAGLVGLAAPITYNGYSINPIAQNSFFTKLAENAVLSDKIMVFIELSGGNDGLNTLIPVDQYSKLALHRSSILIPEDKVLAMSGVSGTGLHPAMTEVREMFDNGLVSVVQRVGYPNQDYSHFRSMDIWMTGANSNQYLDNGWLGRTLELDNPMYPTGYPNADNPDPLAIQIGSVAPVSLMGSAFPMGVSVGNPDEIYDLINDYVEPAPATPYGDELTYIRTVMQKTKLYSEVIKDAATAGQNFSSQYPPEYENELADQLKVIARLINGGLTTQVYLVSIGGFDTHSEQTVEGDPQSGNHAQLLRQVSQAIGAFQNDIELMGKADKVCGMTYSEFGRTIAANDSIGTDHGAAAPLFVFGKGVKPGIIGSNPVIPTDINISSDVDMQNDFRSVYASVLQDWFGLANPSDILYQQFPILPIFKDTVPVKDTAGRDPFGFNNYPNPVRSNTTITFTIPSGMVTITLLDSQGRSIRKIAEGTYPAGTHKIMFDRQDLSSGTYYYQLRLNGIGITRKMLVI